MPIDTSQLQNLIDLLGAETLTRVRQSFLDDSGPKMTQLQQAVSELDYEAIEQLSHSLKSASANLALTDLAEQLAKLEAQAGAHQSDDMQRVYLLIENHYSSSVQALSDFF